METKCEYFSPVAFPDVVNAGLKVQRLGTSSVTYEVGLFRNDDETARLRVILCMFMWTGRLTHHNPCPRE